MSKSEECYQKLLAALERNELIEYLEGKGEYRVEFHEFVPAEAPTDISSIMSNGIYVLYKKDPQSGIEKKFFDSIKKMLEGNAFDIYMAAHVVYDQLLKEADGRSPFKMNRVEILPLLSDTINNSKDILSNYFGCYTSDYKNGVMGVLERWNRNAMKDWGFNLF